MENIRTIDAKLMQQQGKLQASPGQTRPSDTTPEGRRMGVGLLKEVVEDGEAERKEILPGWGTRRDV